MSFFDAIERFGDRPAVIQQDRCVSYRALTRMADAVGSRARERALAFTFCQNSAPAIAGYVGLLRAGIPQALLDSDIKPILAQHLCATYRPVYLWAPDSVVAALALKAELLYHQDGFSLVRTRHAPDPVLHDDLALLLTTSGSTGSPKFVRQSRQNIVSNAEAIAACLEIAGDDRPITTLPMSYTYGLSIINSHLARGAAIVATSAALMQREFWSLLKRTEATGFGGVPYTYEMLSRLRFQRMELPSLKVLTQAGGALDRKRTQEIAAHCADKGIRYYTMYGQTEATARISYVPHERALEKAGSIGVPIPGGRMWLEDEQGDAIDPGDPEAVGELVYAGENVTLGYAEAPADLRLGDENGGVLHTGDMARRDQDGFFSIVGRRRRFLKLFGKRTNLDDVERLFREHGLDVACSGVDGKLSIFTARESDVQPIRDALKSKTDLPLHGVDVRVVESIPRNSAGKVLYTALAS